MRRMVCPDHVFEAFATLSGRRFFSGWSRGLFWCMCAGLAALTRFALRRTNVATATTQMLDDKWALFSRNIMGSFALKMYQHVRRDVTRKAFSA